MATHVLPAEMVLLAEKGLDWLRVPNLPVYDQARAIRELPPGSRESGSMRKRWTKISTSAGWTRRR